jgi:hypothetical protein
MKRNLTLSSIIALLAVCMLCTSCSKDEILSNRISGKWQGEWGMSYVDRDGINHNSAYSVVEFYPNEKFDTQGYGYQEDYYHDGPFARLGFYFEWRIDHKTIFITYPGHAEYNCVIRDYNMQKKHFTGYIGDTPFDLTKIEKYYKWYDYVGRYVATGTAILLWMADDTYYYYDDYYDSYAKTRPEMDTRTTSAGAWNDGKGKPVGDMKPLRIYNRYAEK